MSIKRITVAAIAALGLSLGAYSASAGPLNQGAASLPAAKSPSTFTLVRGGMGGGGFGGHGGFGGGMGHGFGGGMGGMGHGFGMGGMGMRGMAFGPRAGFGPQFAAVPHAGFNRFGRVGAFNGRHPAFFHGRHGFFRHGRFFPLGVGVGLWGWDGYGYGYGGGSCYWNCRAAGFGPGYCSAYSYNFCY